MGAAFRHRRYLTVTDKEKRMLRIVRCVVISAENTTNISDGGVFDLILFSVYFDLNVQFDWRHHFTRVSLRHLHYLD